MVAGSSRASGTVRGIQFLRAVAALGVVYYHAVDAGGAFSLPSTGQWGVDIFFVISGFIIGMIVVQDHRAFFRRRVFRVVPLYALATLLWAGAVLALPARAGSTEVTPLGLLRSLLFIPYEMTERPGPIIQIGWTLNYEMFFYVVVAVMLWTLRNSRRALAAAALLLLVIVGTGAVWPASGYALRFYQSPLLLEFLSGLLLAFLVPVRWRTGDPSGVPAPLRHAVYAGGAVLLVGGFWALIAQDLGLIPQLGAERALSYGLPAVAIVAAALLLEPLIRDGRLTRGLLEVGDASYAMYLFHPFVTLAITEVLLARVIDGAGTLLQILLLLATLAAVVLSSIAINRWIDRPVQRALKSRFVPRRVPERAGAAGALSS